MDEFFVAKEGGSLLRYPSVLEELTEDESRERWWRKQLTEKLSSTIIRVVKREETVINYHKEFEHTQSE